ncbi:MAG: LCP family protein [Moorea sp. SIO2B7]|nr:LCP family protein [Moorena sp. SIO2B7]
MTNFKQNQDTINRQLPRFNQDAQVKPNRQDTTTSSRKLTPHSPFSQGLLWGVAFTLTATVSATIGATIALVSPLSPIIAPLSQKDGFVWKDFWQKEENDHGWGSGWQYNLSRPVNILVMGIDRVPDIPKSSPDVFTGRSDTMLLVRFDPTDNSLRMLSIPRDTRVENAGLEIPKINQANKEGGPALAARILSKTLNNLPIDRYVRVTTDAFTELVNLVGGIEVFVPERMYYVDQTQGLEIDLEPGWQTLSGEQAEHFARFRSNKKGDIGRVQRQQALLKALRKRLQSPAIIPRIPQMIRILRQYVDTNLSLEEMLALANFSRDLERENFKMVMLPGRFSKGDEYQLSYWIMSSGGRDRIMKEYFDQKPETRRWSRKTRRSLNRVPIAVQNTTDEPGLARSVVLYLAENDFYNVYIIENSSPELRKTEIIVQQGDFEAAKSVKKTLGLGRVEASSTGHLDSELTIRVGLDWLDK